MHIHTQVRELGARLGFSSRLYLCRAHMLHAARSSCSIVASYDVLVLLDTKSDPCQAWIALQLHLSNVIHFSKAGARVGAGQW